MHGKHPFDGPLVKPHYAPNQILTPVHTDIRLNVDIPAKTLTAHVSHVVSRHPTAPFDPAVRSGKTLVLNAIGFFNIEVLSESNDVTFHYDSRFLTLMWKTAFNPAEERRVDIKYTIKKPISGLFFSCPDAEYTDLPVYAVTDHETERCRYWLPCVDYPSVRATIAFEITCPEAYISLANGHLVQEFVKNGQRVTQWKLDYTCPSYLITWAVGEFTRVDDVTVDNIPISYFATKPYPPSDIRRAFDKTPSMISWLQEKLKSPFPWPKYYQIAAPHYPSAMENISLVTWNERYLMDETWAKERKLYMDLVNIHEMAHTYFGDLIVIRHFDQVWMKESWATYMESCWLEDHVGEDAFRYEMHLNAEQYIKETESYVRPIVQRSYASSWSLFDSHTYPGGAWRIHMLRKVLGDNCFWTAIRQYVAAYRGTVVETEDFRKILESQSGLNLIQFFDQWYYSKGFPQFRVAYEYESDKKFVKIAVEQTQVNEAKGIPLFNVHVDIEVVDETGKKFQDVVLFEDDKKSFVVIPIDAAKPKTVRIDPNGKLLFSLDFNPGEQILFNNAKFAPDVVTRIKSFEQLIKIGTLSAFEKVKEALASEKFYGVRVHVATALAESKLRLAVDLLAEILLAEKDPMAIWQIARECKISDPKLRTALKNFLVRQDLAYRAREFALESLGYQANLADFEYLLTIAKDNNQLGQHNFIRCGALRGLSYMPSTDAYNYLYERASKRGLEPRYARETSVAGLARVTLLLTEKAYRKKTIDLLRTLVVRDPDAAVRKAAIGSLVSLEAKEAAGDIESSRALTAEQDWEWLDAQLKRLSTPGSPSVTDLTKKIEILESRLRAMEEKFNEKEALEKSKATTQ